MTTIYVKAKQGCIAFSDEAGKTRLPPDQYVPVRQTAWITRLLTVTGDIEQGSAPMETDQTVIPGAAIVLTAAPVAPALSPAPAPVQDAVAPSVSPSSASNKSAVAKAAKTA